MTEQLVSVDKVICRQQDRSLRSRSIIKAIKCEHYASKVYAHRQGTYKSPNDRLEASTLGGNGDVGRLLEPAPDSIVRPT